MQPITGFFIFFIFLFSCLSSNAQFGAVNYIDTLPYIAVSAINAGDFDNDGFNDAVILNNEWPNDKVIVYYNNQGLGFGAANILVPTDTFTNLSDLAVGDIDNDGWDDILISQQFPNQLFLLKNNAGTFNTQLFASAIDFPSRLIMHDVDNNGLLDVISLQHLQLVLYLQQSNGFQPGIIIHSGTEFYDFNIGDFNNDGFTDVAIASVGFEILLNDGNGNFTLHSDAGNGLTFNLGVGDIDNDNDLDLITWEALLGIFLYTNDGNGNFMMSNTIFNNSDNFSSFFVYDFDKDNDLDLYISIGQLGSVGWFQNNGTGTFTSYQNIHTEQGEIIYEVFAADINNDNKKEIFWGDKKFAFHFNLFPTNIENIGNDIKIKMYPNPSDGKLFFENSTSRDFIIKMIKITGELIYEFKLNSDSAFYKSITQKGVYIINIYDNDKLIKSEKLIIH